MGEPTSTSEKPPTSGDHEEIGEALALARTLAERLAHAQTDDEDGYAVRLAHALTLDIVDLLEDARDA